LVKTAQNIYTPFTYFPSEEIPRELDFRRRLALTQAIREIYKESPIEASNEYFKNVKMAPVEKRKLGVLFGESFGALRILNVFRFRNPVIEDIRKEIINRLKEWNKKV